MSMTETQTTDELTLQSATVGYPQVPASTLLTRLNYFDGKFLRADDLRTEQEYHRRHVELSNRGGGAGVVEGFDVTKGSGDDLAIGAGLAIDGAGRVLYLPDGFTASLAKIIEQSSRSAELAKASRGGSADFALCLDGETTNGTGGLAPGAEFYEVSIAHAEDACGNEDVYGKLCEDACATDEQRRYLVEGIVVRATPFRPQSPFPTSKVVALTERHVRSQLASAWFADEAAIHGRQMSAEWLRSGVWCRGARREPGNQVPIAIVLRTGAGLFVDEWIVRRERIEPPPRRYWAWSMAMRPWEVFLAQILQFQCQLASALPAGGDGSGFDDPCKPHADALAEAERMIEELGSFATAAGEKAMVLENAGSTALRYRDMKLRIQKLRTMVSSGPAQALVDGGIVELPSAGYLPVLPGANPSVEDQVRRLMGDGVDLRFCTVRADYVPHALEEAQHMERISLLAGLDNPAAKPAVDVYVPDAATTAAKPPAPKLLFDTKVMLAPGASLFAGRGALIPAAISLHGAGRAAPTSTGGAAFYFAGATETSGVDAGNLLGAFLQVGAEDPAHLETISEAAPAADTPVPTAEGSPAVGAPLHDIAADARAFTVERRLGTTVGAFKPTWNRKTTPVSLWAEMHCHANPLSAKAKDSIRVSIVVDIVANAAKASVARLELHGNLLVRRVSGSGLTRAATCVFKGLGSAELEGGNATGGKPSFPVVITRRDSKTPRLTITLQPQDSYAIEIGADWPDSRPYEIQVAASAVLAGAAKAAALKALLGGGKGLPLAGAALKEDPNVGDSANAAHVLAVQALDILEAALQEDDFAETGRAKLFPGIDDKGATTLTATKDWVLFQRRRTSDCGPPPEVPPAPAKTVRYRVYEHRGNPAEIQKYLQGGKEANLKKLLTPVGDVEFTGTDTLVSPATTLAAELSAASPGPTLAYAALVTDETETPDTLESRAHAYEDAVSGVSATNSDTEFGLFPDLEGLRDGADGILVLVTTGVAGVVHCVYALNTEQQGDAAAQQLAQDGDVAAFAAHTGVTDLGTIAFEPGTDTVIDADTALTDLQTAGVPRYMQATLSVQEKSNPAETEDEVRAQVKRICDAVKPAGTPPDDSRIVVQAVDAQLSPCSIVTVLKVNSG